MEVGTKYKCDNEITEELPFDMVSTPVEVMYDSYQGWNCDLTDIDQFDALPKNAGDYILALEKMLDTKISIVSTGPERSELILR